MPYIAAFQPGFPDNRILTFASAAASALAFGVGTNALLRPRSGLALLQLPAPSAPTDRKLVENLIRMYGVRNLSMGLAAGIMTYFGHARALGWYILGSSVVAIVDGIVSREVTGGGEWNHWIFVSASVGLSGSLLGWAF
jgi:hypothetical protein